MRIIDEFASHMSNTGDTVVSNSGTIIWFSCVNRKVVLRVMKMSTRMLMMLLMLMVMLVIRKRIARTEITLHNKTQQPQLKTCDFF